MLQIIRIIKKAIGSYSPITFSEIKDESQVKDINKHITNIVQSAQNTLDTESKNNQY